MSNFHYLNNDLKVVNAAEEAAKRQPINNINVKGMGGTAGRIYAELNKKGNKDKDNNNNNNGNKEAIKDAPNVSYHQPIKKSTPYNAAHFSTGAVAQSFTSTAVERVTVNEKALINEDEYMYKKIKSKAYVRINTNMGNFNIELYCDKVKKKTMGCTYIGLETDFLFFFFYVRHHEHVTILSCWQKQDIMKMSYSIEASRTLW